jgi:hypothetical protein
MSTDESWSTVSLFDLAAREYMISRVIQVCADLHLFSLLMAEPLSTDELAKRCQAGVRGTEALLIALQALGIVKADEGTWSISPEIAQQNPDEDILAGMVGGYRDWLELADSVRTGAARAEPSFKSDRASMRQFLVGMHLSSWPVATELAAELPLEPHRILDLGGGLGTYSLAICEHFQQATATVLELAGVADLGRQFVSQSKLGARVRFMSGDYLSDPFPRDHDLVLMCNILHQEKPSNVRRLFRKVAACLPSQGWLIIHETMLEEGSAPTLSEALAALNHLLYFGGQAYSEGQVVAWLRSEDLKPQEVRRSGEPGVRVILAQKVVKG